MKKFVVLVMLLAVSSFGCGSTTVRPTNVKDPQLQRTIDFERVDYDALESAIIVMTNQVRAERDLAPLPRHRVLAAASRRYAEKMVAEEFLAHLDPNTPALRTPEDRIRAAGGANAKAAENIADVPAMQLLPGEPFYVVDPEPPVLSREPDGPPIPAHTYIGYAATVVEGWMNSPGHRRNLLDPEAVEIGVGAAMYRQSGVPAFVVVQKFQLYEPLQD